jgi:hypothetical protein
MHGGSLSALALLACGADSRSIPVLVSAGFKTVNYPLNQLRAVPQIQYPLFSQCICTWTWRQDMETPGVRRGSGRFGLRSSDEALVISVEHWSIPPDSSQGHACNPRHHLTGPTSKRATQVGMALLWLQMAPKAGTMIDARGGPRSKPTS